ncbi:hypothetical protein BDB01DRAFT_840205 [Pilobolus umbonatus]|nr:hypothetical protein BDB01DRAFT_840205 [Pilobolus umbonatus]
MMFFPLVAVFAKMQPTPGIRANTATKGKNIISNLALRGCGYRVFHSSVSIALPVFINVQLKIFNEYLTQNLQCVSHSKSSVCIPLKIFLNTTLQLISKYPTSTLQ